MEHPVYCMQYLTARKIYVELKLYSISDVYFVQSDSETILLYMIICLHIMRFVFFCILVSTLNSVAFESATMVFTKIAFYTIIVRRTIVIFYLRIFYTSQQHQIHRT